MGGFRHISTRLIVAILSGTAAALFALGYYQQAQTRRLVLALSASRTSAVAGGITEELQGVLRAVESSVRLTAARLERSAADPAEIEATLRELVATNDRIYGATAAFEPSATPDGSAHFAPYVHRQAGGFARTDLATPAYAYWEQEWYTRPLAQRAPWWTEPYFDKGGGNVDMVTYAVPFFRPGPEGPRVAGVVTADIALGWLKRVVESKRPGQSGFILIFSGSGRIIAHPIAKFIMAETLDSLAAKYDRPENSLMGREVAAGHAGSVDYVSVALGTRTHVDYRPVHVGGWGVAVGFDEEEFLLPVREVTRTIFWSGLAALAVLAAIIVVISRRITQPLFQLAGSAGEIARGNLDVAIPPPRTRDEVGRLTAAFGAMRDNLRHYIADLAAATAARQKLESEIAIAQQIQRAMLPAPRASFPGRRTVEISTQIQPAKTVGGDLFAYFSAGPGRLCFAVGDVSDKGVPAALFMARTITLLRTIGREATAPDDILRRVNTELCPDNDECMFVTLFCALLDLETGELTAVSAGHEPPLVCHAAGGVELWELPAGPALGLEPAITLPLARRTLEPGDTLLLYTDGVTDAANPAGELFTRERLQLAAGTASAAAPDFTAGLLRQVNDFAGTAPQADDITLFTLRWH